MNSNINSKMKLLLAASSFVAFVFAVSFISNRAPHAEVQAAVSGVGTPNLSNIGQNTATVSIGFSAPAYQSTGGVYTQLPAPSVTFIPSPGNAVTVTATRGSMPTASALAVQWNATATLTGLSSNTITSVHATINQGGFTATSQAQSFTTLPPGAGLPGPGWPWPGHTTTTSNNVAVEGVHVTNNGAQIRLNVIGNWGGNWGGSWNQGNWNQGNWNQGAILDRGIVFSRTNTNPWVNAPNTTRTRIDGGGVGSVVTSITGRPLGVTYHVRGWVRTNQGYFHSPHVLSFTTGGSFWGGGNWGPGWGQGGWGTTRDSFYVSTNTPNSITHNSASLSGTIHNRNTNSPVIERGFVWSTTSNQPTINHSSATASGSGFGTFSYNLTGLTPNTRYYVSAYFRIPGRIFYGNVVNFTTDATGTPQAGEAVTVNVSFRSLHGPVVGSQEVSTTVNQTLSATNLTPPAGFQVWPPSWSYRVTGNSNINVFVAQSGAIPPGVAGTPGFGQAGAAGQEFFPVAGNFQFRPDFAVTRGELAQAIFNLNRGGISAGPAIVFSDVAGTPFVEAINFVSSRGYMVGYPDGTFRPNSQLTRAEMAAFLNNMYNLTGFGQTSFIDMPAQHWASNFVSLAADRGMVAGFPDGTFRPEDTLTRAQATALLVRSENRSLAPLSNQFFSDVPQTHWASVYIRSAAIPRP